MRTKTLLATAAALAAGVIVSQAQSTVYSANVVGYINLSIPANTLQMVANQLDTGSNTLDNVFQSGVTSGKTTVLEWNGAGYNKYVYLNCSASPSSPGVAGFYDEVTPNPSTWIEVGHTNYLQPGQGAFMQNGTASAATIPTVGQVIQGTNVYSIGVGDNIYSIPEPLAGLPLDNTNINFPVASGKTTYLAWNGTGYNKYVYLNCSASPSSPGVAGFYDEVTPNPSTWIFEDTNSAIWAPAGGSFFIDNGSGASMRWTNVFEVQ